jgi:hypothetical protein
MTPAERKAEADRFEREETERIEKLAWAVKESGIRISFDNSERMKAEIKRIAGVMRRGVQ